MKLGIMGSGQIVDRWIKGARQVKELEIVAIASRTMEHAVRAAEKYGIPAAMSYDEMAVSPEIDAVYIPVPHVYHKELAMKAMRAKKHILVEKPMAVSEKDAKEMMDCAAENGVFLIENIWTLFFPGMQRIHELCTEEGIGMVKAVDVCFSFDFDMFPEADRKAFRRIYDPALAGGGLLDTGVYPLHFAQAVYGAPAKRVTGYAAMDTDDNHYKVDEHAVYVADHGMGRMALMASGFRADITDTAYIYGTKGKITVPVFWKPTVLKISINGIETEEYYPVEQCVEGFEDEGFQYLIRHMVKCVENELSQSPVMTWEKSLSVLRACDSLRKEWGLKYPFE